MEKFERDYQLDFTNSYVKKSLVYRRCENVYNNLVVSNTQEISNNDLEFLIKKYIGGSQQTVEAYRRRFVDFKFLKPHSQKPSFMVNYENNVFSSLDNGIQQTQEKASFQPSFGSSQTSKLASTTIQERDSEYSKTVVHHVEGEKKRTCSFKGYGSIWQAFKEAVWKDGFPDICYVEHIFHVAYLESKHNADKAIHVPFRIGNMNCFITLCAPYVVQRPRRIHRHIERETIDEKESL